MKYTWTYKKGTLSQADYSFFKNARDGFEVTGETLEEKYDEAKGRESGGTTYVVYKATGKRWTPYGMCRDCGDHYIIAKWSHYVRIEKDTLERTVDVEDF